MQWTIVADSGCDRIPAELAPNIRFRRVPLTILLGDDEWVDTPDMNTAAFVDAMQAHKGKSSSACPAPEVWEHEFLSEGNVIAITITGGLSGSFNSAIVGRDMVWEQHPGKPIYVLDSRSAGAEMSLLVDKAVELIGRGLDFDTVTRELWTYHQHTHLLFMLDQVDNLVKNGRLNKLVGAAIGVLGIRIVGVASEHGTLQPLNKLRSLQKCYNIMVEEMEARGYAGGAFTITHIQNEAGAKRLADLILARWPNARCSLLPASGLCSYYAENQGLLLGFEDSHH